MIARVLLVWIAVGLLVLGVGTFSQGEELELSHLPIAFWLALPAPIAVLRGGLGESGKPLEYPSVTLMVVSAWILIVGPSLVVESQAARYLYHYSDAALTLARMFFFGWCLLFTVAAGRPRLRGLHVRPTIMDYIACAAFAMLVVGILVRAGNFSNYQSSRVRSLNTPIAGTTESSATVIGTTLFTLLPSFFFMILHRLRDRGGQWLLVMAGFLSSWILLFLLGSRTGVAVGVASCLLLCRAMGLRLRTEVLLTLTAAVPATLILILLYRSALSTSETEKSVLDMITIATDVTSSLDEQEAQTDALDLVSKNARSRLWYAQQFSVLIDHWLDEGAALRGTLFSGVISSVPTLIFNEKNDLAADLNFEVVMSTTQRFPSMDLAPMPWMQWLYELGILGLIVGALTYAWIVRTIEQRISGTRSPYEVMFWIGVFVYIVPPEHTTDTLVLSARGYIIQILLISAGARALTWLTTLGRRAHATQ